eukprot:8772124-Lingulodinium_polyedra.AAC.1
MSGSQFAPNGAHNPRGKLTTWISEFSRLVQEPTRPETSPTSDGNVSTVSTPPLSASKQTLLGLRGQGRGGRDERLAKVANEILAKGGR